MDASHPRSPMPDWRRHFIAADTEHEVVSLAREHVASWQPAEIANLPPECRPGRIRDSDDISQSAYELARAHCSLRYEGEQDLLVMRLLAFMSEAAIRMAEVKALEAAATRAV